MENGKLKLNPKLKEQEKIFFQPPPPDLQTETHRQNLKK
jgi:hypothetical protein